MKRTIDTGVALMIWWLVLMMARETLWRLM